MNTAIPHEPSSLSQNGIEIRQLTAQDLPSLLELYIQLDAKNRELPFETPAEIWREHLEGSPYFKIFGAVKDGQVISTCSATVVPNLTNMCQSFCVVENVVTHKDFRKQGLARRVMDTAIAFARSRHCYKVMLLSGAARKEAHQFYENLGFSSNTKKAFDMRLSY